MIIIDGEKVKVVSQTVEREISTDDFLKEVANQTPVYFPLIPANTKGFVTATGSTALIIEQAPRTQNVTWRGRIDSGEFPVDFQIHLPWVYFCLLLRTTPLAIEHIQMFFAKSMVTKEDDKTGWMLLPNVKPNNELSIGEMCGGQIRVADNQTLPSFCADLIAQVWGSLFNRDLVQINPDGIAMIRKEMDETYTKEYITKKKALTDDPKEQKKFDVLIAEDGARYMYAWQEISKNIDLPKFISELKFSHNWTYKKTLEGIKTFTRR